MKSLGIKWKVDGEQVRTANWADLIYVDIEDSMGDASDDVVHLVVVGEDLEEVGIRDILQGGLNEIFGNNVEG